MTILNSLFWYLSSVILGTDTMKSYTTVVVVFRADSLLDFDELIEDLESQYRIGYAGLFYSDSSVRLVLQTIPRSACFVFDKVAKICAPYQIVEILPFDKNLSSLGEVLQLRGRLRAWGGSRRRTIKTKRIPRSNVRLYTHALGKEDVSHIKISHLRDLVGSEDEIVAFFERNYTPNAKRRIAESEWRKFRRYSRDKVRRWDEFSGSDLCGLHGIQGKEEEYSSSDSDGEEDLGNVGAPSTPPLYDPDSDSEGNRARKRKLFRAKLVEQAPKMRKEDFLKGFEMLILDNPHNSNVIASTKDGYFKYFDGNRWIKAYNEDFFNQVTLTRISKAADLLKHVSTTSTGSEFTRRQVAEMVRLLLKNGEGSEIDNFVRDNTGAVKDGILAAENQGSRLEFAERALKRKIVRVGSKKEGLCDVTWKDFERGDIP